MISFNCLVPVLHVWDHAQSPASAIAGKLKYMNGRRAATVHYPVCTCSLYKRHASRCRTEYLFLLLIIPMMILGYKAVIRHLEHKPTVCCFSFCAGGNRGAAMPIVFLPHQIRNTPQAAAVQRYAIQDRDKHCR